MADLPAVSTSVSVPAEAVLSRRSRAGVARDLFSLAKPRLSSLVLVTCTGGMLLAPGHLSALRILVAALGTAMVVAAANALNCYLERDLDRRMARTRLRPLAARRLDPRTALWFAGGLLVVSLPVLAIAINPMTALLGGLALVTYVAVYTPLKPHSSLAMWVGAVPGAVPPLMGWTAMRDRIEAPALVLFAVLFFWQLPHFIAIGVYRREEYAAAGHRILPAVVSPRVVNGHMVVWSVLLVLSTLLLEPLRIAGPLFGYVAAIMGGCLVAGAVLSFFRPEGVRRIRWARGFFYGTLMYLTTLFAALCVSAR